MKYDFLNLICLQSCIFPKSCCHVYILLGSMPWQQGCYEYFYNLNHDYSLFVSQIKKLQIRIELRIMQLFEEHVLSFFKQPIPVYN